MSTFKKVSIDFYWKKEKLSGDFSLTYQVRKGWDVGGGGGVRKGKSKMDGNSKKVKWIEILKTNWIQRKNVNG